VACAFVQRHTELVRQAVFYEPALLAVVPDAGQVIGGFRAATERAMAVGGPRYAMEVFMRANAGDAVFDVLDPTVRQRCLDNAAVLFDVELPVFATYVPDLDRLRGSGVPLTVLAGADNRETWFGAAAAWLADGTGAERVDVPGGHVGYVSHSARFVDAVRRIIG
jgi:hypothetical protein